MCICIHNYRILNMNILITAPFAAGPLADIVGRKWALLSSTLFYVVSYILLVTANSVGQMYAARLIQVCEIRPFKSLPFLSLTCHTVALNRCRHTVIVNAIKLYAFKCLEPQIRVI